MRPSFVSRTDFEERGRIAAEPITLEEALGEAKQGPAMGLKCGLKKDWSRGATGGDLLMRR
jgi:hypothetical protein